MTIKKIILISIEKITSFCASSIIPISTSLRIEYEAKFKFIKNKIQTTGSLSIAGVDLDKFDTGRFMDIKDQIKKDLGIPANYFIIGFVARLTVDKGVGDFIALWGRLKNIYDNIGIKEIKSNNNKEIDIKWYDITKSDHPLWINENTLPKRLTRFVDERYILTDTNEYSQKIMVVLGLIIIIITIIELYIREFKNDKYKIKETNIQLKLTLSVLKIFSSFAFLYYFIPNLILRTSKPNDDTIQLDKNI